MANFSKNRTENGSIYWLHLVTIQFKDLFVETRNWNKKYLFLFCTRFFNCKWDTQLNLFAESKEKLHELKGFFYLISSEC